MKLNTKERFRRVYDSGKRSSRGFSDDFEIGWDCAKLVSVRHPNLKIGSHPLKKFVRKVVAVFDYFKLGESVLSMIRLGDFAPKAPGDFLW
jgi:hypothetical protein